MDRRLLTLAALLVFCPFTQARAAENVPAGAAQRESLPFAVRPLHEVGVDVSLPAGGPMPHDYALEHGVAAAPVHQAAVRGWPCAAKQWSATNSVHRPLYFEQVNAERYGYGCAPCLQPVASTAHFFASAVALPYQMAADCPRSCVYTLGHYRPGDCVPRQWHYWPCSVKGGVVQAATVVGLVALIP
jgi:hypothetical protein